MAKDGDFVRYPDIRTTGSKYRTEGFAGGDPQLGCRNARRAMQSSAIIAGNRF